MITQLQYLSDNSIASDVILRVDDNTGEVLTLKEATTYFDGSAIDDTNISDTDLIYHKVCGKFYVDTDYTIGKSIDVKRAGAVGDGITDDTAAIREAIKQAYRLHKTTTAPGWIGAIPIFFPHGKYLVTDSLITSVDSALNGGRFYFTGAGAMNTEIIFKATDKYLFDDNQIFGFTTFEGLKFTIDAPTGQKFMNFVGGNTGNAQALIFKDCVWENYKNIVTTSGNTQCSEVIFFGCRVRGAQTGDCMFEYSNSQGMNWRFFGTDIEVDPTTMFRFKGGGGCVNFYQGSLITSGEGKIIHVPDDGIEAGYGDGNWPSINFWGCKYELHTTAMLVHIENPYVQLKCNWYGCGMGMGIANITPGRVVFKTMGLGWFNFDNCYGFGETWKAEHTLGGFEYTGYGVVRVIFVNNCPTWEEITSGSVDGVVNRFINGEEPVYSFTNCGPNRTVKPFNKNVYSGTHHNNITTRITTGTQIMPGKQSSVTLLTGLTLGTAVDCGISVPDGEISFSTSLAIKPAWVGGYGGMHFNVNVYNDTGKTQLIGTGDLYTDDGIIIKLREGKPLYFTGTIIVELTALDDNWGTYEFEPHIIFIN